MKIASLKLRLHSATLNKWYTISRFTDYDVSVDMDTDVDQFSFTFDNPEGIFSGLVSGFDRVKVLIDDKGLMLGAVDHVSNSWSESESSISVSGRDLAQLLTDNDVTPMEKKNLKPKDYISELCKKVGVKYEAKKTLTTVPEFEVNAGTSYLNAISQAIERSHQDYWWLYDTLYTGSFNTGGEPKWRFTRGVSADIGIPILSLSLDEDYSDARSEIRIYGSNDNGSSVFVGNSKLDIVKKRGFTKVSTKTKDEDVSNSVAKNTAKKDLEDIWRNCFNLTITVMACKPFMPNQCCTVIDKYFGINNSFYIRSVRYTCNISNGHICELTLVPSDATLKKLMNISNVVNSLVSTDKNIQNTKLSKVLDKYSKKWS